jgi:vacuolar-type H+-ATPase subunit H
MKGKDGGGTSRSTHPADGTSAATDISLREYFEALRHSDDKVDQWIFRFYEERDRRLADVAIEREKALKIKEEADKRALDLQAETQAYKDEKANELRSQIERERGAYVTQSDLRGAVDKIEATIKPLIGTRREGIGVSANVLYAIALLVVAVVVYFLPHH